MPDGTFRGGAESYRHTSDLAALENNLAAAEADLEAVRVECGLTIEEDYIVIAQSAENNTIGKYYVIDPDTGVVNLNYTPDEFERSSPFAALAGLQATLEAAGQEVPTAEDPAVIEAHVDAVQEAYDATKVWTDEERAQIAQLTEETDREPELSAGEVWSTAERQGLAATEPETDWSKAEVALQTELKAATEEPVPAYDAEEIEMKLRLELQATEDARVEELVADKTADPTLRPVDRAALQELLHQYHTADQADKAQVTAQLESVSAMIGQTPPDPVRLQREAHALIEQLELNQYEDTNLLETLHWLRQEIDTLATTRPTELDPVQQVLAEKDWQRQIMNKMAMAQQLHSDYYEAARSPAPSLPTESATAPAASTEAPDATAPSESSGWWGRLRRTLKINGPDTDEVVTIPIKVPKYANRETIEALSERERGELYQLMDLHGDVVGFDIFESRQVRKGLNQVASETTPPEPAAEPAGEAPTSIDSVPPKAVVDPRTIRSEGAAINAAWDEVLSEESMTPPDPAIISSEGAALNAAWDDALRSEAEPITEPNEARIGESRVRTPNEKTRAVIRREVRAIEEAAVGPLDRWGGINSPYEVLGNEPFKKVAELAALPTYPLRAELDQLNLKPEVFEAWAKRLPEIQELVPDADRHTFKEVVGRYAKALATRYS